MKLTVLADLHYFDPSLGTEGTAYALRSGSDQKCLAETGAIIDAAFAEIAASDTDAVLIAGDLTNDGERVCHEGILTKLYRLKEKKPVYVTTATHDWCCDQNPRRFEGECVYGDVETVSPPQLRKLYYDFGETAASAVYVTHLGTVSYLVELPENVSLLVLNDDQNGKGKAGYKPEHLCWILQTIRAQTALGKTVVAMQHHLLYPHISPLLTGGACCGDREALLEALSEAGLRFMFVGHSHIQHTARYVSSSGKELFEINVGSLCGYPAPMVQVEITNDMVRVHTDFLKSFSFAGRTYDAQNYLRTHAVHLLGGVLDAFMTDQKAAANKLAALGVKQSEQIVRKYWHVLRFTAVKLNALTAEKAGVMLNRLPGGVKFRKEDLRALQNVPVLDLVYTVLCSILSGRPIASKKSESYARVVYTAGQLPQSLLHTMPCKTKPESMQQFCKELASAFQEIVYGSAPDNLQFETGRRQI